MLIYGQIPSNAGPSNFRPAGSLVGGLAFALGSSGGDDSDSVYVRDKARKLGERNSAESDQMIEAITPILHIICP